MKSENLSKLLPFYFGSLKDAERLQIERVLLEDPESLLDYFDIKREMENAAVLPAHPSPKVWAALASKISDTPPRKLFLVSFGFAAAVAALLCVFFLSKPHTQKTFDTRDGSGILFEGAELSGSGGVL